MIADCSVDSPPRLDFYRPQSFADWRGRLDREHAAPIVAIAGSRGKTSVLRAVESIFQTANFRTASWTNRGVEIEGEGQRGELGPWSRVLTRLSAGGLDIAFQEIDWATVQAIGSPERDYPIVAIANLCGNNGACLATPETMLAHKALARIRGNLSPVGRLVLNAHDHALAEDERVETAGRFLVGITPDAPILRRHLQRGGDACCIENSVIVIEEAGAISPIVDVGNVAWLRDGNIQFSVQNALMAAAIARTCGLSATEIAAGLMAHKAKPETMPGSFNVFDTGGSTIVVDRPMPSWFLRTSLRAAANLGPGRQIRVVGPMPQVPRDDLAEVGRLVARHSGIVIVHGFADADRLDLLRHGAAANEVPPLFVQASDERQAIQQGIDILKDDDVLLILAENAPLAVKLVSSRVRRMQSEAFAHIGVA